MPCLNRWLVCDIQICHVRLILRSIPIQCDSISDGYGVCPQIGNSISRSDDKRSVPNSTPKHDSIGMPSVVEFSQPPSVDEAQPGEWFSEKKYGCGLVKEFN